MARRLLRQESGCNNFHKRNGAIGSDRRSRAAHRSEVTQQTARSGREPRRADDLVETTWKTTTTTDPDDRRDDVDPDDDTTTFLRRLRRIPELPVGAPEDDHDVTMTTTTFLPYAR